MIPFLSVCLIVKNEEKVLRRCLESVKGIADEIIIADTGSSDKSKDIALEYTEKVYDYIWEDDFSKARNFVASKASGEWIMAIDADEYCEQEDFISFKNNLKKNTSDSNILAVQIVNFVGNNGKNTILNYHERIYKNDGKIHYYRNIHELLRHKESLEKRGFAQLQIFHSGYMGEVLKEKNKANRNLALLKNKKEKEAIDYYFLGDVYSLLGDLDNAIINYKKAYQVKDNITYDWVVKVLIKLINCLQATKQNKEAFEIISASEEIFNKLVDFKFLKGQFLFNEGKVREAIEVFEEILLKKDELKVNFSVDYSDYLPHKYLGELYEQENQLQLAVQHYSKSLSINDADDYIWVRLINLLAKHSTIEELIQFINSNCINRRMFTPVRLVRILLNVPNLNVQKLSRSFLNKGELSLNEKEALLLKNLFLDESYEEITMILNKKNINEITLLLSQGILGIIDFILLTLETNDEKLRKTLFDIKFDKTVNNLLCMLFGGNDKSFDELSLEEEDIFIGILKQAHVMSFGKIIKLLNKDYLSNAGKNTLKKEMEKYF
jgi:glycosyltransferase involved in cell wall biosynthesis